MLTFISPPPFMAPRAGLLVGSPPAYLLPHLFGYRYPTHRTSVATSNIELRNPHTRTQESLRDLLGDSSLFLPFEAIWQPLLSHLHTSTRALPSPWPTNFKRIELLALVQLGLLLLPYPRVQKLDSLKTRRSGSSLRVFRNPMSTVLVC